MRLINIFFLSFRKCKIHSRNVYEHLFKALAGAWYVSILTFLIVCNQSTLLDTREKKKTGSLKN